MMKVAVESRLDLIEFSLPLVFEAVDPIEVVVPKLLRGWQIRKKLEMKRLLWLPLLEDSKKNSTPSILE